MAYSPFWDQVNVIQPNTEETAVSLAEDNPDHIYFYVTLEAD